MVTRNFDQMEAVRRRHKRGDTACDDDGVPLEDDDLIFLHVARW